MHVCLCNVSSLVGQLSYVRPLFCTLASQKFDIPNRRSCSQTKELKLKIRENVSSKASVKAVILTCAALVGEVKVTRSASVTPYSHYTRFAATLPTIRVTCFALGTNL